MRFIDRPDSEGRAATVKSAICWKVLEPLPDGPLDIVGDIHGEIGALDALLSRLGYGPGGSNPQGRKLVFLGDLIDRGPDSPGVVRWVADMVDKGNAVTVMGNHDLNAVARRTKKENTWLFGHGPVGSDETPITLDRERTELIDFLRAQPLARERPDLRVVHACWDAQALADLRNAAGPHEALEEHRQGIRARLTGAEDAVEKNLAHQNQNPIKLITSGPEARAAAPFFAGGKMRQESREAWWNTYETEPVVVFGHYWRIPIGTLQKDDGLLSPHPLNTMLGKGKAICIDYSVGGRASERRAGRVNGPYAGRLAALRWPERELVFDDGERMAVVAPQNGGTA